MVGASVDRVRAPVARVARAAPLIVREVIGLPSDEDWTREVKPAREARSRVTMGHVRALHKPAKIGRAVASVLMHVAESEAGCWPRSIPATSSTRTSGTRTRKFGSTEATRGGNDGAPGEELGL